MADKLADAVHAALAPAFAEMRIAELERELRAARMMFSAAALSAGGTLRIRDSDLVAVDRRRTVISQWYDHVESCTVYRVKHA